MKYLSTIDAIVYLRGTLNQPILYSHRRTESYKLHGVDKIT